MQIDNHKVKGDSWFHYSRKADCIPRVLELQDIRQSTLQENRERYQEISVISPLN